MQRTPSAYASRWRIAVLVGVAISISYLDRQTLPWTLSSIGKTIPISNQAKAFLDSSFLITYGLMYLGGGRLLDILGTRTGFAAVMLFWSLACASHALAGDYGMSPVFGVNVGIAMLAASRLLLGAGEGGGFPAATRAVAECYPLNERSLAMGIINAGTAVGALAAPPLIVGVLTTFSGLGLAPWRWVFLITGVFGLLWTGWWWVSYRSPTEELSDASPARAAKAAVPLSVLLRFSDTWVVVFAKFLTDGAWYFYLFWLPKFLLEGFGMDLKTAGRLGWIPYAASGIGCLCGGALSGFLLRRGWSVNASRKIALGASAALMPWIMLAPHLHSAGWVIFLFSLAFFGQQSWSTLIMVLPTDMISQGTVGTLAGLVGFGGALGGIALGQLVGYLRDHGSSFTPVLMIAGSLHVVAFVVLCVGIPRIRALDTLESFSPA